MDIRLPSMHASGGIRHTLVDSFDSYTKENNFSGSFFLDDPYNYSDKTEISRRQAPISLVGLKKSDTNRRIGKRNKTGKGI